MLDAYTYKSRRFLLIFYIANIRENRRLYYLLLIINYNLTSLIKSLNTILNNTNNIIKLNLIRSQSDRIDITNALTFFYA